METIVKQHGENTVRINNGRITTFYKMVTKLSDMMIKRFTLIDLNNEMHDCFIDFNSWGKISEIPAEIKDDRLKAYGLK